MSITPVGGWRNEPEGEIVPRTAEPAKPSVIVVQAKEKSSSSFAKAFFGCMGVICALWCIIFLSSFTTAFINGCSTATANTRAKPMSSRIQTDSEIYTLFSLSENKNQISTGTAVTVKGFFYQAVWTHQLRCDQLLMWGRAPIQHGEADPADYCTFSVLLTEKRRVDGYDTFPNAAVVCDVTPQELKVDTKLYRYGDRVQVSGLYAPSLDFDVSPIGVPRLTDCAIAQTGYQ
jgi:hypothetical protein